MPEPCPKRGGEKEYWVQEQKQKEVGAGYLANDDLGCGEGRTPFISQRAIGTQCQGQNQPSRIKSKLLTGPLEREAALGVVSSPYEKAGKYSGGCPKLSCRWKSFFPPLEQVTSHRRFAQGTRERS